MAREFSGEPPIELLPLFRERVWGRTSLAPLFPESSGSSEPDTKRIGEVWFTFTENRTSAGRTLGELLTHRPELLGTAADPKHPSMCPILVKLLFTTERLSVQVHPDDAYAAEHHGSLGKTEAWYVIDSEPPGEVAVGFQRALTQDEFEKAIHSGEIEGLLHWRNVKHGDVIFTPAGTVHAIGAGVTICEIQENSDITYRLYDYGRTREVHLEHGTRVSVLRPHEDEPQLKALAPGREELVECQYFRIERLRPTAKFSVPAALKHYAVLICTNGSGQWQGTRIRAGQAWFVPALNTAFTITAPDSEWILTYKSTAAMRGLNVD